MTSPLRVILVDDEPLAIERLEFLLRQIPSVQVVGTAGDGPGALDLINRLLPDLVFLDVRMPPQMDGLELVEMIDIPNPPAIIFVTAHSRFAASAFDLAAADYVLKPIEFDRLTAAVERARAWLGVRAAEERIEELQRVVKALREEQAGPAAPSFEKDIWLLHHSTAVRVPVADIQWLQAEGDYIRIHTANRSYLLRRTMADMIAALDPRLFMRVHRSAAVRLDQVARVAKPTRGTISVILACGAKAPVGRAYAPELRAWLQARAGPPPR